jgi:ABC-type multidrug transport system fused ATPase/permease subunit
MSKKHRSRSSSSDKFESSDSDSDYSDDSDSDNSSIDSIEDVFGARRPSRLQANREQTASSRSSVMFNWVGPLIEQGAKSALTYDDLTELHDNEDCNTVYGVFEQLWNTALRKAHKENREISAWELLMVLLSMCPRYWIAVRLNIAHALFAGSGPFIIGNVLQFVQSPDDTPVYVGFLFASLLCLPTVVGSLCLQNSDHILTRLAIKVRGALMIAIFKKSMRLSAYSARRFPSGHISMLLSIDCQKPIDYSWFINWIYTIPIMSSCAFATLYWKVGLAASPGMAVFFLLIWSSYQFALYMKTHDVLRMSWGDHRLKALADMLHSMNSVKVYAWETPMMTKMTAMRDRELSEMKKMHDANAIAVVSGHCFPPVITAIILATYVFVFDVELTIVDTFVALASIYMLDPVLGTLVYLMPAASACVVAGRRITEFLVCEERNAEYISVDPIKDFADSAATSSYIHIEKSSFSFASGKEMESGATFTEQATVASHVEDSRSLLEDNEGATNDSVSVLHDIMMHIDSGELVAVIGGVGSGKSALLHVLLGNMVVSKTKRTHAPVVRLGSKRIALVQQAGFMMNTTVKQNIIMGSDKAFNKKLYNLAIKVCCLESDLKNLPLGELMEVSEGGSNLSGGQRQRISMARAVYADADIYLFDDPLSAVDAMVAHTMFTEGIYKALAGKTRLLVTHQVQFLPKVDRVLYMQEGKIVEDGNFHDLMALSGTGEGDVESDSTASYVYRFLHAHNMHQTVTEAYHADEAHKEAEKMTFKQRRQSVNFQAFVPKKKVRRSSRSQSRDSGSVDIVKKKKGEGESDSDTYTARDLLTIYLSSGIVSARSAIIIVMCLLVLDSVVRLLVDSWLGAWSVDRFGFSNETYVIGFSIGIFVYMCTTSLRSGYLKRQYLTISRNLHSRVLKRLSRAPLGFFGVTPPGRILSRFSRDQFIIDLLLPENVMRVYVSVAWAIQTVVAVATALPVMLVPISAIVVFVFRTGGKFLKSAREIVRLEADSRSPILSHASEAVIGTSVIRVYNQTDAFCKLMVGDVDLNSTAWYNQRSLERWMAVRLESFAAMIGILTGLVGVGTVVWTLSGDTEEDQDARDQLASLIGLALSYAMALPKITNTTVRQLTEARIRMNAVERIHEYSLLANESSQFVTGLKPGTDIHWPSCGHILFKNLTLRYRPDLPPALRDVSLVVPAKRKVGIVGRTGAGKSTFISALFRLVEIPYNRVFIDGVDVRSLGLEDLRRGIAIIPQVPHLFEGSIRGNVDPFSVYTDLEVLCALNKADLLPTLRSRLGDQPTMNLDDIGKGLPGHGIVGKKSKAAASGSATQGVKGTFFGYPDGNNEWQNDLQIADKTLDGIRERIRQMEEAAIAMIPSELMTVDAPKLIVQIDGVSQSADDDEKRAVQSGLVALAQSQAQNTVGTAAHTTNALQKYGVFDQSPSSSDSSSDYSSNVSSDSESSMSDSISQQDVDVLSMDLNSRKGDARGGDSDSDNSRSSDSSRSSGSSRGSGSGSDNSSRSSHDSDVDSYSADSQSSDWSSTNSDYSDSSTDDDRNLNAMTVNNSLHHHHAHQHHHHHHHHHTQHININVDAPATTNLSNVSNVFSDRDYRCLESPVDPQGSNFSIGQQQLVCLCRALLQKPKILVLDEATASCDVHTDALIQNTIKEMFADTTILTVAHRINTIEDYDVIIVMHEGEIVECNSPGELLKNPESLFTQMHEQQQ